VRGAKAVKVKPLIWFRRPFIAMKRPSAVSARFAKQSRLGYDHMRVRRDLFVSLLIASAPACAAAQSSYYNLDAGRPMRIEDAEPTPRYALGIDLAPVTWEHLATGTNRYRTEPRATYGLLPFTDIELRLPIVAITPPRSSGARSTAGVAGLAVGLLHELNLETPALPAFALGGETSLPVGSLAATSPSYIAKLLVTRTFGFGRMHLNAGAGRYAVRLPKASSDSACTLSAFVPTRIPRAGEACPSGPPIIVDQPCDVAPIGAGALARAMCMGSRSVSTVVSAPALRNTGPHWFTVIGFDHAYGLRSMTIVGDILAERFVGLYAKTDWSAELGARQQLTPLLVADEGLGWHFAGTFPSVTLTIGASYELAVPPLRMP